MFAKVLSDIHKGDFSIFYYLINCDKYTKIDLFWCKAQVN